MHVAPFWHPRSGGGARKQRGWGDRGSREGAGSRAVGAGWEFWYSLIAPRCIYARSTNLAAEVSGS